MPPPSVDWLKASSMAVAAVESDKSGVVKQVLMDYGWEGGPLNPSMPLTEIGDAMIFD